MLVDPTVTTALHFTDFGSVYTPDGREHPVTAMTPAFVVASVDTPDATDNTNGGGSGSSALDLVLSYFNAKHTVARIVVGLIAILIFVIVVIRLIF